MFIFIIIIIIISEEVSCKIPQLPAIMKRFPKSQSYLLLEINDLAQMTEAVAYLELKQIQLCEIIPDYTVTDEYFREPREAYLDSILIH